MNNPLDEMLLKCWQLTLGETAIYGNAIGIAGEKDRETAQGLIEAGHLEYSPESDRYRMTREGIEYLRTNGLIE